jgi:CubicO group peptidase (beta-lactamase class C family)
MIDIQQQVQKAVGDLVDSGAERGLQVAVYPRGELTVDAVAGLPDQSTGRAVTSDILFHVTSTGKGLTATAPAQAGPRHTGGPDLSVGAPDDSTPSRPATRAGPESVIRDQERRNASTASTRR